ncbi:MAG: protein phosphatase 2C domain-containing protein [Candidatus Margulisiibacteriota bacterium]
MSRTSTFAKPFVNAWRALASLGKPTHLLDGSPKANKLSAKNIAAAVFQGTPSRTDDRILIRPATKKEPGRVWLADGAGAQPFADEAATIAVTAADNNLAIRGLLEPDKITQALRNSLQVAHQQVQAESVRRSNLQTIEDLSPDSIMITTLTGILIINQTGYVAHAGDSIAFLARKNAEGNYLDSEGNPLPESLLILTPDQTVGFRMQFDTESASFPMFWKEWGTFSTRAYTGSDNFETTVRKSLAQGIGLDIEEAFICQVPLQPSNVLGTCSDGLLKPFFRFYGGKEEGIRQFAIILLTALQKNLPLEEVITKLTLWSLDHDPDDNIALALLSTEMA